MAGTAVLERLNWRLADVVEIKPETPRAKTLDMRVPEWGGHLPGQHVDVRLTAEDGYQAQRSYSIASAPGGERLELTVELLEDGEVSPYLAEELRSGDRIELRGPIGGYFTWDGSDPSPLLLIGGGSGVVPLMAMIRHRAAVKSTIPARLLYSSRAWDDVIYREELGRLAASGDGLEVTHTLTRSQPAGWSGHRRRIDVTTAVAVCAGCGAEGPVAGLMVYGMELGAILRCPGCDTALIRISRLETGPWLDLRGASVLRVPAPNHGHILT
jgi:ferredoxin-NADP reductase